MATPKFNSNTTKAGPLASLYGASGYDFTGLFYPDNLATSSKGHHINFFINSANKSQYIEGAKTPRYQLAKDPNGNQIIGKAQDLKNLEGNQVSSKGAIGSFVKEKTGADINLQRKTKRITRAISLYMPETINVQYNAGWQDTSLTEALGGLGGLAQAGQSYAEGKSIGSTVRDISSNPAIAELAGFGAEKSGLFGSGIKEFAQFTSGTAINPQLEVLFTGTQMREFQFDFLFTPKNKEESENIRRIIKEFKFHMAPEIYEAFGEGRYLTPPSEFDIDFMMNGAVNQNIHKISSCVLTNMNVDYAPSGWTTYNDGMPVQTRMTLQFKEIEIMTKQRIEQGF